MRRGLGRSCMLLAVTVLAVLFLLPGSDGVMEARIVTVETGDVVVTAHLTGRLGYTEESAAVTALPGQIAEILVAPGEHVAAGQALLCLDAPALQLAAEAFAARPAAEEITPHLQTLLQQTVIRAPQDAVVRRVLVQEGAAVSAGEAVLLLSGSGQVIRCVAAERDARDVQPGMTALVSVSGRETGTARVTAVGPLTADAATGRLVCEVTLTPDDPLSLPQGASVDADVILQAQRGVPVLPMEAMTTRQTLWWVHDGICTEIPAEIVLSDENRMMVALPEGTAVAIGEFEEGQRLREAVP